MFHDRQFKELNILYSMVNQMNVSKFVRSKLASFIKQKGHSIVGSETVKPLDMVRRLVEFKTEVDTLVTSTFDSDARFVKTSDESFAEFLE